MTEPTGSFSITPLVPKREAIAAIALVLIVFVLAWRIPLPGLDLDQLAEWETVSDDVAARLSILALGVTPLFTILAYVEVAKLALPPLARWQARSTRNAQRLTLIVVALALLMTAMQGYGLLMGLEQSGIVRRDVPGFMPTGLASLIAVIALLIWLADRYRFADLGSGFWLLMMVPFLADFPSQAFSLIDRFRTGVISGGQLLIVGLLLLAGIAAVVFANLLLSRNGSASAAAKMSILLWPPFLAGIVAGYAFLLLPTEMPSWPFFAPSYFQIAYLAVIVICIPIFVLAYARVHTGGSHDWSMPVLLVVTAIQIGLLAADSLLPTYWDLPLVSPFSSLLVMGTVLLALRRPAA